MDLLGLDTFRPRGATAETVDDVDTAVTEINRHRPLPEQMSVRLTEDLLYDRIYSSAVTEGNRLSRRETIAVLSAGVVEAGSRKDVTEIRNLGHAILLLDEFLRQGVDLTEGAIRELHKKLLTGLDDSEAGSFRNEDVAIAGSPTVPPPPGDVPDLVRQITEFIRTRLPAEHPLILAAWGHWAITRVHPFRDGNGRVARLVQDYVLLRRGYVTAPLFSEDRQGQYYDALEAADKGETQPFVELLSKNILRVADRFLSAIQEDETSQTWLEGITRTASERIRETEYRRYVRWDRRIASLKLEFEQLGEELAARIPGLRLRVRDYQGVDFDKYKALRTSGRAERTWAFGVHLKHEDVELRFVFWVARRFRRPGDPEAEMTDDPVLLVSMEEQQGQPREERRVFYRQLDDLDEAMVTLRELVARHEGLARRRYNPVTQQDEWDFDISPGKVARDFYTETMQKLFLA